MTQMLRYTKGKKAAFGTIANLVFHNDQSQKARPNSRKTSIQKKLDELDILLSGSLK